MQHLEDMKQFILFLLVLALVSCRNQTLAPGPNEQQGAQGPQGVPGPQGERGLQGLTGPANSSGTIRAAGTCLNGVAASWSETQSLFGGATCNNYKGFLTVTIHPSEISAL